MKTIAKALLPFLAIAVLALGVIDWASPEHHGPMKRKNHFNVRIVGALLLIALGILGGQLSVGVLTTLVFAILLLQVGYDVYARLRESGPISQEAFVEESGSHA